MVTTPAVVLGCTKLLDMRDGYPFARNVLGFSDPSVAWIRDRWVMFIGGMSPAFHTNIFSFELPPGDEITSNAWRPSKSGKIGERKLRPIVAQPRAGSWNRCMHSVCYVQGVDDGIEVERIYHAGRSAQTVLNARLPYRIGYLERRGGEQWRSIDEPLALHGPDLPSVLEPKVEYHGGRWHLRFLTIPGGKPGSEDPGEFRIMYTSSVNGRDGWTPPVEWFGRTDGFFDSVVIHDDWRALMVITRDSDLEGKEDYPLQGVWLSSARSPDAPRPEWSPPERVFEAEAGGHEWTGRGMCSPSAVWGDDAHSTLCVFFAGAPAERRWFALALQALRARRRPPLPSPLYFTIGRLDLRV